VSVRVRSRILAWSKVPCLGGRVATLSRVQLPARSQPAATLRAPGARV
jgi:hypothetical protein